jgi:hypothetical protein
MNAVAANDDGGQDDRDPLDLEKVTHQAATG